MDIFILVVFVLGYAFIALEHNVHIDKAASALVTGTVCWALFVLGWHEAPAHLAEEFHLFAADHIGQGHGGLSQFFEHRLLHHMEEISSILFFLMGAMTIVELIDAHEGFRVITDRIQTRNKVKMLWIVCVLTFFFSALLDNLTTSIVMVSLLRKLIDDRQTRWLFAGMVVIAANAGGAWSPIGDVTTTMLWIGGQLTTPTIVGNLILPSIACLLVPLALLSFKLNGDIDRPQAEADEEWDPTTPFERNLVFAAGVGGLLFVPVFKTVTHLPPFMGMMLSLGVLWMMTERLHRTKNLEEKSHLTVIGVLRKIDSASVLFFLGILLAVAALQEAGHLILAADWLRTSLNDVYLIDLAIGLLSARGNVAHLDRARRLHVEENVDHADHRAQESHHRRGTGHRGQGAEVFFKPVNLELAHIFDRHADVLERFSDATDALVQHPSQGSVAFRTQVAGT